MSETRATDEVPFSDLLQHPRRTTARLDQLRTLRLRRRDAVDLLLMSADQVDQEYAILEATALLLAELVRDVEGQGVLARVMPRVLPWMMFLPDESASQMLDELARVATAATSVGTVMPLAAAVSAWKHTAEIYADPELLARFTSEHAADDHGAVVFPGADL